MGSEMCIRDRVISYAGRLVVQAAKHIVEMRDTNVSPISVKVDDFFQAFGVTPVILDNTRPKYGEQGLVWLGDL